MRREGVAVTSNALIAGCAAIAAPVFTADGSRPLVVAVVLPIRHTTPDAMTALYTLLAPPACPLADEVDEVEVLRLAGALESASEHPIAAAVARGARDRIGTLPEALDFTTIEGLGVQGLVDGHAVLVGPSALLEQWSQPLTSDSPSWRSSTTRSC